MPIRSWLKALLNRSIGSSIGSQARRRKSSTLTGMFAAEVLESRQLLTAVNLGPQYQVNPIVSNPTNLDSTYYPTVAMDAKGNYVVVWNDQQGEVFAQRYSADGTRIGDVLLVNPPLIPGSTSHPMNLGNHATVAMDAAGDFVITWMGTSGVNLYARAYDANGNARGDEFVVAGNSSYNPPSIAMDKAGDFVIVWGVPSGDVFARMYDSTGNAEGDSFRVNTQYTAHVGDPVVAMDADGDFVVAWVASTPVAIPPQAFIPVPKSSFIEAQRFSRTGVALGSEFQVDDSTTFDGTQPSIAMDASGDFVVSFRSSETIYLQTPIVPQPGQVMPMIIVGPMTETTEHVDARRYDSSGHALGGTFHVTQSLGSRNSSPNVTVSPGGQFAILWTSESSTHTVYLERYDANGSSLGDPIAIDTSSYAGSSLFSGQTSVVMSDKGSIVTVFGDMLDTGTGGVFNIYARNVSTTPVKGPSLSSTPGFTTYTENDPPTPILSSLIINGSNQPGAIVTGAQVHIATNYQMGQDRLAFFNTARIHWTWDATTGTLTLTGAASAADYQQMLRSVTYQNVSNKPVTYTRNITFQIFNGSSSNTITGHVRITAVNDPPVISGISTDPLSYKANSGAVVIAPTLQVFDPDSNRLTSARVTIANFQAGDGILSFTNTSKIRASWDGINGVLILTGTATDVEYQAALRSVTYKSTQSPASPASKTITFEADEGSLKSNIGSRIIVVSA